MILPKNNRLTEVEVAELTVIVAEFGCRIQPIVGDVRTIYAIVGDERHDLMISRLEGLAFVDRVDTIQSPHKLMDIKSDLARHRVKVGGITLGDELLVMAGLCTIDPKNPNYFYETAHAVKEAGAKADIIVLSNYQAVFRAGKNQDLFTPAELMKWTEENSPVPVVGLGGFMVEEGGMFAVGASGFEQGDTVAHMAMTILDRGEIPRNIPEVMPRQFLVYMRESLLAKRGITLPPLYEAFSRASNNYHK